MLTEAKNMTNCKLNTISYKNVKFMSLKTGKLAVKKKNLDIVPQLQSGVEIAVMIRIQIKS